MGGQKSWTLKLLMTVQDSSMNVRHRLIQFRVVHRLYYTKSKLHLIYTNVSYMCNKCKQDIGSPAHHLWLSCKPHGHSVVQGRNSGELATGSWEAKAH